MKPTAAMIFAAGFGTRMAPLTDDLPKPMIPVAGRPMIDHAIDLVREAGIETIVANVHYLADRISPHLKSQGVVVSDEAPDILDTGGGLRQATRFLGDGPVITINPDAVWLGPNPVAQLLNDWRDGMAALLTVIENERAFGTSNTGDFSLERGEIHRNGPYIYGGVQIIDPSRLSEIHGSVFSLNAYWDHLAETGPLHGTIYPGRWCDIGTPDGLSVAEGLISDV